MHNQDAMRQHRRMQDDEAALVHWGVHIPSSAARTAEERAWLARYGLGDDEPRGGALAWLGTGSYQRVACEAEDE